MSLCTPAHNQRHLYSTISLCYRKSATLYVLELKGAMIIHYLLLVELCNQVDQLHSTGDIACPTLIPGKLWTVLAPSLHEYPS